MMMVDRLSVGLIDAMGARKAQLAREAAVLELLTANPLDDPTGVHRAIAAAGMYRTMEEIQELEGAVARLAVKHNPDGPTT
jgi:hypothetical protein